MKGDSKKVGTAIQSQGNLQRTQQQEIRNEFLPRLSQDNTADVNTRNEIESRYKNFNPSYNLDALMSSVGGGGSASGGIDPNKISEMGTDPYAGYKTMSQGLRPEFWGDFNKHMGVLDEASSGYRDFSKTGGFNEGELQNIRGRSLAPTRSIYQNAQDNLATMSNRTGMNQGGYAANQRKLTREANEQIGNISQATEANIAGEVQRGKQFGTQGLERTGIAGGQMRSQVEALDQQMKAAGLGGMTEIEKTRLMAELQNASINSSASGTNAGLANQRAALQLQADITGNNQRLSALQGWGDLYGTAPGATGQSAQNILDLQQLSQGGNMNLIGQQIQATQIPSDYQQALGNISGTMGLVGQAVGTIYGKQGIYDPYKNRGINPQAGGNNPYGGMYTDMETAGTAY